MFIPAKNQDRFSNSYFNFPGNCGFGDLLAAEYQSVAALLVDQLDGTLKEGGQGVFSTDGRVGEANITFG